MAVIKSGATSDQLTIDVTSKAARITSYDVEGVQRGIKSSYRVAAGSLVAAASAAPFLAVVGSGTKTIRVQRIRISGPTLTAVAYNAFEACKYSTDHTGGTSTTPAITPSDSTDAAATAVVRQYTAAPTAGTLTGIIGSTRTLLQATTAAAAGVFDRPVEFDFRNQGSADEGVIRGAAQNISIGFQAAPATAVTLAWEVEFTEE